MPRKKKVVKKASKRIRVKPEVIPAGGEQTAQHDAHFAALALTHKPGAGFAVKTKKDAEVAGVRLTEIGVQFKDIDKDADEIIKPIQWS